ncbi:zeta toxin family protein [Hymenobacter sp. BT559]|nr:zeta toxin family protein [Hymenobacter sp. BT559]
MFAGPNGAGKTTIYQASNREIPQVNADAIQQQNPAFTPRRAGIEAGRRIEELLKQKATFSTKNNFHKSSNLNPIARYQEAGYRVEVTFVSLQSAELCKERVASRVAKGGHDIPDKQVEERYVGGLETIKQNYHIPDKVTILDNSSSDRRRNREPLLTIEQGKIVQQAPSLPQWVAAIKDHIRQVEREGPPPQQQFKDAAAHVVAGLQATGQAADKQAAFRLQEVDRFVERVPYVAGLNKENTEKAIAAADKVPSLARSPELLQLRAAAIALEQPMHERHGPTPDVQRSATVPVAARAQDQARTPTLATSTLISDPTATQQQKLQAKEQFLQAVGPVAQGLRANGEGLAAARLQDTARFVEKVVHLGGINQENVVKAISAADKVPSLSNSKELGELKSAVSVLEKPPAQERGTGQSDPSRESSGVER